MASGHWSETDKPNRPGFYNRFKAAALARIEPGKRGVIAMPVKCDWGPANKVVSIKDEKDLIDTFGNDMKSTAYKLGRLSLLGQPQGLLLYRITDGTEKSASIILKDTDSKEILKLETLYPTKKDFNVTVKSNLISSDNKDLTLYEGAKQVYVFQLSGTITEIEKTINQNKENKWLKASKLDEGNGKLASISNESLTGGNDGNSSITNEHYLKAMNEFEGYKFNGFCLDGITDAALQTSVKAWIERNRKNGKKIRAYLGGDNTETIEAANKKSKAFNNEGIYYLSGSGGILNGIKYTPAETMCYIAALGEGQGIKECLCNAKTIFENVTRYLTDEEIQSALVSGTMIIRYEDGSVLIEDDVNTLKTYRQDQNENWGYLRAIKFMDMVDEDTSFTGVRQYVGKSINKRTGQLAVLCALKQYFEIFEKEEIIESGFKVQIDENLQKDAKNDEFFWRWDATYINVMKRIYGTGYIS
ncbi:MULTISPECIES: phage tail sheath family protein [Clostridium]|uniref:Tail sheath protein n=1 Tax=Clostridium novyi B str. ATCC 27606 TaxID=1443123 RepID=A0AA40IRV1_CLONO|nr:MULTISPECIES: phage tail sheath family protein [Clostridium]KEI08168.1 putative tail sheath protein [Clostridium novyi B str. NCTC 9691]KEI11507.1 putative tail sheath protein [Clostridium novyi B str. ATCC 27606]KLU74276.1 putative tail sheath protein [Clostridium botulinum V891]